MNIAGLAGNRTPSLGSERSCCVLQIVVHKHKAVVRFGFMHMLATNVCMWTMTTITETADEIRLVDGTDDAQSMSGNSSYANESSN